MNAAAERGVTRQLVIMATGVGKTVSIAAFHASQGSPNLYGLMHRDELLKQSERTFLSVNPDLLVGIEKADLTAAPSDRVILASVQTVGRKDSGRLSKVPKDWPKIVWLDEVHHAPSASFLTVLDHFGLRGNAEEVKRDRLLIGTTATPDRLDKLGYDKIFDDVVFRYGLREAIRDGWLVDIKAWTIRSQVDLSAVPVRNGDYVQEALDQVVNTVEHNQEVARIWADRCSPSLFKNRRSLFFCITKNHARALAGELTQVGAKVAVVVDDTAPEDRVAAIAGLKIGALNAIANVGVFCLDDQTEILTDTGWVGIEGITYQHRVANWDKGRIFFDLPKFVIRRNRMPNERMVFLNTRYRSIRVTEDHRMLYRTGHHLEFRLDSAGSLTGRRLEVPVSGIANPAHVVLAQPERPSEAAIARRVTASCYNLKKRYGLSPLKARAEASRRLSRRLSLKYKHPSELSIDECLLIGFWLGDGVASKLSSGGVEYTLCQSNANPKIVSWVDRLCARLKFDFLRKGYPPRTTRMQSYVKWSFPRGTGFGPQKRNGLFHLEPYLNKDGSELLWSLNQEQFDAVLLGLWYSDGDHGNGAKRPNSYRIFGANRKFFDLFQAVATCRNYKTHLWIDPPRKANHRPLCNLSLYKRAGFMLADNTLQFETDVWRPEKVWCVTSTSGNVVTRRNGTVTMMGNSEGFDLPEIDTIHIVRPTKSQALYTQMVGRGTRKATDKDHLEVYDHIGHDHDICSVGRIFGLPDAWDLHGQSVLGDVKELEDAVDDLNVSTDGLTGIADLKAKLKSKTHRVNLVKGSLVSADVPSALVWIRPSKKEERFIISWRNETRDQVDRLPFEYQLKATETMEAGNLFGIEERVEVFRNELGRYEGKIVRRLEGRAATHSMGSDASLAKLIGRIEEWIEKKRPHKLGLLDKKAKWGRYPASDKQKEILSRRGVPKDFLDESKITKREASIMLGIPGDRIRELFVGEVS
jgi:superfamily II DNA or RNA helicase